VDEAGIVELLVASVATVVVLGASSEGVGVRGAVGNEGVGCAALAPRIERLALDAGGGGCRKAATSPSAGVEQVGGAEVIF
jgi:hypothetical protein